jgi:zinc transporter ZupT
MKNLSPLLKGLITGIAMLLFSLLSFYAFPTNSNVGYIMYILYAGGILWTLIEFSKSPQYTGRFQELFSRGFRCFIIVTLVMVIYTGAFSMTHPEMAQEYAVRYKEEMLKQKNKPPAEIEKDVQTIKKQFTTRLVSTSIFGYLISGAIFTAAGAAFILLLRKKPWT